MSDTQAEALGVQVEETVKNVNAQAEAAIDAAVEREEQAEDLQEALAHAALQTELGKQVANVQQEVTQWRGSLEQLTNQFQEFRLTMENKLTEIQAALPQQQPTVLLTPAQSPAAELVTAETPAAEIPAAIVAEAAQAVTPENVAVAVPLAPPAPKRHRLI